RKLTIWLGLGFQLAGALFAIVTAASREIERLLTVVKSPARYKFVPPPSASETTPPEPPARFALKAPGEPVAGSSAATNRRAWLPTTVNAPPTQRKLDPKTKALTI